HRRQPVLAHQFAHRRIAADSADQLILISRQHNIFLTLLIVGLREPSTWLSATCHGTQPIMIGWARRIMIRLEGPAHARVPTCNSCAYSADHDRLGQADHDPPGGTRACAGPYT